MKIITVCGSYKFKKEMIEITEMMTLKGNCMITPNELTKTGKVKLNMPKVLIKKLSTIQI